MKIFKTGLMIAANKIFLVFVTLIFCLSCSLLNSDDEILSISIYNQTNEAISIKYKYTGIGFSWIPKKTNLDLEINSNTSLTAFGDSSGKEYGSQTFKVNNQVWFISE